MIPEKTDSAVALKAAIKAKNQVKAKTAIEAITDVSILDSCTYNLENNPQCLGGAMHACIDAGFDLSIIDLLLQKGANPALKTIPISSPGAAESQMTPLHIAATLSDSAIFERLHIQNPELWKAYTTHGRFPVHMALEAGNADIAEKLLTQHKDQKDVFNIHSIDSGKWMRGERKGWSFAHCAAASGNPALIDRLKLFGLKLKDFQFTQETPFFIAATQKQDLAMMQKLHQEVPESIHTPKEKGALTPFLTVLSYMKDDLFSMSKKIKKEPTKDIIDFFFRNVSIKDLNTQRCLHIVACQDNTRALTLLLDRGLDIEYCDNSGNTPLLSVARLGYITCFKILIDRGADPTKINTNNRNILHQAVYSQLPQIINFLNKTQVANFNWNTAIEQQDNNGDTPEKVCARVIKQLELHSTIKHRMERMQLLLQTKHQQEPTPHQDRTPEAAALAEAASTSEAGSQTTGWFTRTKDGLLRVCLSALWVVARCVDGVFNSTWTVSLAQWPSYKRQWPVSIADTGNETVTPGSYADAATNTRIMVRIPPSNAPTLPLQELPAPSSKRAGCKN